MSDLAARVARAALVRGQFTLASGRQSDVYVDKWRVICNQSLMDGVARRMSALIPLRTDHAAGPELGGVIIATAISVIDWMSLLVVRREPKAYGTRNRIEGEYAAGDTACLIEDVLTTGATAISAIQALREDGLVVDTCVCLVDRQEGAVEALAAIGVEVRALFTLAELLAAADTPSHTKPPSSMTGASCG